MNFSVYNNLPVSTVFAGLNTGNNVRMPMRRQSDSVVVNRDLDRILNENTINDMVNSNPVIIKMLRDKNIQPKIDVENFRKTTYQHCMDTRSNAAGIYNYLPVDLKSEANLNYTKKEQCSMT
ncbi:MAG: hypothetical protein LUB59_01000 [Candidatus Gastranaerophilales bacterium]|nr:hypothetical protein [Candidatus Gastranaerophilales bacterium]